MRRGAGEEEVFVRIERIELRNHDERAYLDAYLPDDAAAAEVDRRHPAVVVCPGGAYLFASEREGKPVALRFAAQGYRAFVLRYATRYRNREEFVIGLAGSAESPEEDEDPILLALYSIWPKRCGSFGRTRSNGESTRTGSPFADFRQEAIWRQAWACTGRIRRWKRR